jgi:hypothetical protein
VNRVTDLHALGDDEPSEEESALVAGLLADLGFLREPGESDPASDPAPAEQMPDWVWDRISTALAAEAAPARGRHSRAARWAGGLVAASVALVVVGVSVTSLRSTDTAPAPVAAEAAADQSVEAPAALSFAGIPPMRMVVDSDTRYTTNGLRDQVRGMLSQVAIPKAASPEAAAAPAAASTTRMMDGPATGFLATDQSLQDCLEKLSQEAASTAFLIDHSTFDGQTADVVVAPQDSGAPQSEPTSLVDAKVLEIWVVDPNCDMRMQVWLRQP